MKHECNTCVYDLICLWSLLHGKRNTLMVNSFGRQMHLHEGLASWRMLHILPAGEEDCSHLFVTFEFTGWVSRLMRGWIAIDFPIPASDNPCLSDWWLQARQHFQTCYRAIFDTVFMLTYCWFVWKERNARIFLAEITNTRAAGGGSRKSL